MNRKAASLMAAVLAFCAANALAGEEAEDVNAKVAESLKTVQSPDAIAFGPAGKKAAMEYMAQHADVSAPAILDALAKAKDESARLWLLLSINAFADTAPFNNGAARLIALIDSEDFGTKYWAVKVLGRMKAAAAVKPIAALLNSKLAILRREAVVALGEINDTSVAEPVAKLLKDTDATVRAAAAETLGSIKAPAKAKLIEALTDDDLAVVHSVVTALEAITGKSFGIEQSEWVEPSEPRQKKIDDWVKQNS